MSKQFIPVGIFEKEIFIAEVVDGKMKRNSLTNKPDFSGVLRPVSVEDLDDRRDCDSMRDNYKEEWKTAVAADATEDSFEDWLEQVWAESFDEDDPEDFPDKDSSDCEYLTDEMREEADNFLMESEDYEAGTWESSGFFNPGSFSGRKFKKFDYVFNNPLSKKLAKEYVDSLKK